MEPLQFPGRPSTGVYGYRETVSVLGVWCHKMAPLRQPRISSGLTMPPDGHIFNRWEGLVLGTYNGLLIVALVSEEAKMRCGN